MRWNAICSRGSSSMTPGGVRGLIKRKTPRGAGPHSVAAAARGLAGVAENARRGLPGTAPSP